MKLQHYHAHLALTTTPQRTNPEKIIIKGTHWRIINPEKPNQPLAENTYHSTSPNGFTTTTGLCIWFKKQLAEHNPDILETILANTVIGTVISWVPLPDQPPLTSDITILTLTTKYTHRGGRDPETIITLAEHSPRIAAEADGWNPNLYPYATNKIMPWRCSKPECGHTWGRAISQRTGTVPDCPKCKGRILIKGHNDLATTHPHLAATAIGWDPTEYQAGSEKTLLWGCENDGCDETWEQPVKKRIQNNGCQKCSNSWNYLQVGYNDLATTHPHLAKELVDIDPTTVKEGANIRALWKCSKPSCQHEWRTVIANRAQKHSGCPVCQGRVAKYGVNDIYTQYPHLVVQVYGWDPRTIPVGSKKRLMWKCDKKECSWKWLADAYSRTVGGTGCPSCTNRVLNKGYNDLATKRPDLIAEAQFDPTEIIYTSHKMVQWKCAVKKCSWVWKTKLYARSKNPKKICPSCTNHVLNKGYNDLATLRPDLAIEAQFNPTEHRCNEKRRLPWKCSTPGCGHTWKTTIKQRAIYNTGCAKCAKTGGYRDNEPGYLYLLTRTIEGKQQTQIGISNKPEKRLAQHKRNNWQTVATLGPCDGQQIHTIEQTFLHTIRNTHNIRTGLKAFPKKFDGYTEAWWNDDYSTRTIADILSTCGIAPETILHVTEQKEGTRV